MDRLLLSAKIGHIGVIGQSESQFSARTDLDEMCMYGFTTENGYSKTPLIQSSTGRSRKLIQNITVTLHWNHNDDVVINTLLNQSLVLREAGVEMAQKPKDVPTSKE